MKKIIIMWLLSLDGLSMIWSDGLMWWTWWTGGAEVIWISKCCFCTCVFLWLWFNCVDSFIFCLEVPDELYRKLCSHSVFKQFLKKQYIVMYVFIYLNLSYFWENIRDCFFFFFFILDILIYNVLICYCY